jgi:deazaflavin-dependent oxidoreductase (nitroreductase family)
MMSARSTSAGIETTFGSLEAAKQAAMLCAIGPVVGAQALATSASRTETAQARRILRSNAAEAREFRGGWEQRECRVLCSVGVADWNKNITDEFRAKAGKGIGHFGDKLLLLTTRGAKSGKVRTTPLVYHRDGDKYVIAASMGGAPTHPAWYHNLVKHREADIEVGTEKFKVRATPIAKGPERDRLYQAHGDNFVAFRDYPPKTKRIIPVVVLERIS